MSQRVFALALIFTVLPLGSALAEEPGSWVDKHRAELVDLYRDFHQHPELSFQEKETAARLAKELKAVGAEVTTNFGGYGVVGILANGPGPRIMLRTDLDALPVTEQTGLVYASRVMTKAKDGQDTGIMHACGHDIHITNQIGVARYLAANKDLWSGTVMFIGQPAEEIGGGAKIMLDAGLFTKFPKPDMALALHVDSTLPTGKVGYRAGYSQANVDSVDITIRGRGGHGATPHMTIDPIVEAARLVLDLQTIISREIKAQEPAVITVGSIHAGTKHNIISDSCTLQLTVRSYSPEVPSICWTRSAARRMPRPSVPAHRSPPWSFPTALRRSRTTKSSSSAWCRSSGGFWVTRTSWKSSRRWGAKISASMAWPACRFSCFGWGRSIRNAWPVTSVRGNSVRPYTRPCIIPMLKRRWPRASRSCRARFWICSHRQARRISRLVGEVIFLR